MSPPSRIKGRISGLVMFTSASGELRQMPLGFCEIDLQQLADKVSIFMRDGDGVESEYELCREYYLKCVEVLSIDLVLPLPLESADSQGSLTAEVARLNEALQKIAIENLHIWEKQRKASRQLVELRRVADQASLDFASDSTRLFENMQLAAVASSSALLSAERLGLEPQISTARNLNDLVVTMQRLATHMNASAHHFRKDLAVLGEASG